MFRLSRLYFGAHNGRNYQILELNRRRPAGRCLIVFADLLPRPNDIVRDYIKAKYFTVSFRAILTSGPMSCSLHEPKAAQFTFTD